MKNRDWQISLAIMTISLVSFSVTVNKTKLIKIGYTINPSIIFKTNNKKSKEKLLISIFSFFSINYSRKSGNLVITRKESILRLLEILSMVNILEKRLLPPEFSKEYTAFAEIMEIYTTAEHHTNDGFFKVLDLRTVFSPKAKTRQQFIADHFGGN